LGGKKFVVKANLLWKVGAFGGKIGTKPSPFFGGKNT
jgi:hypothetical protein